jgi:hypothetical protein
MTMLVHHDNDSWLGVVIENQKKITQGTLRINHAKITFQGRKIIQEIDPSKKRPIIGMRFNPLEKTPYNWNEI